MSSIPPDPGSSRDTGPKGDKESKIPNPQATQRAAALGRRSPFSVTEAGSPRLMPMSLPPMTMTLPASAATSKIPRRSQTPAPANTPRMARPGGLPTLQRSSLPPYGARNLTTTPMSSYSVSACNMPFEQFTNPTGSKQSASIDGARQGSS